ncbi:2-oxoisovalerate dehydrogenase [Tessaracoccus lapidicaptus]|uniref:2-oxoisovalerate dehydrogenase n=1 Tax=Tessaracoccus lapidicaptus TaxID=1427523 RepID=A0A1C0AMI0_9ACTN|nr:MULTISPECIES: alpha-ketoacid dehydrogenase subunit beta [Tessaracoccus]AQX15609.1 alpha-ketoacid dehydrogenase subunit beta [Tessaracoccus sp. T2.5-30]OCL33979.1 2-oxoisovalerate dehydrogenase [Tessaracoccus lapidicaptus]VEP39965.1 3-methyl-2-oxobutanoate dehydrogenase subunit beta [Tessaracoccus lapidicaptus]
MSETLTMAKALNRGLRRALQADPKVLLAGEDIGKLGGVFRITEGLQAEFGENRVVDSPLAESGIIGTAVGLAMRGYRPVVEIQFDGFVFPGFSQIVTQVAKMHMRTGGHTAMPMVIRIPFGGGIGAIEHHSESPEAYFAHTPGLKVVACSNANDAYWMIQQAIQSDDPVVFLEPKRRYHVKGAVNFTARPAPMHQAQVSRYGTDATLLCYGPMVKTCLDAAAVAAEEGTSLEVVDLRTLSPLDWVTIESSARRTKRAIVVHEAPKTLGVGAEIAAKLHEDLFYVMESPVLRVAGYDMPYPPSRVEEEYLPGVDRILDAVDRSLAY